MPQKSILTFFSKAQPVKSNSGPNDVVEKRKNEGEATDSPVKKKKRVVQQLVSDDEGDTSTLSDNASVCGTYSYPAKENHFSDEEKVDLKTSVSDDETDLTESQAASNNSAARKNSPSPSKCDAEDKTKQNKKAATNELSKGKDRKNSAAVKGTKGKENKSSAPTKVVKGKEKKPSSKQSKSSKQTMKKNGKINSNEVTEQKLDSDVSHQNADADQSETESASVIDSTLDESNVSNPGKSVEPDKLPTDFNPSKSNFHPVKDAIWKHNDQVPYQALASTLNLIEATGSRLKMIDILANYLRSVIVLSPHNLLHSIYLCLNKLGPAFEGIELGLGDMVSIKAIGNATGRSVEKIKSSMEELGDLGEVAEQSCSNQKRLFKPPRLTVAVVFKTLREIAEISGNAAMNMKVSKVTKLLVASEGCESKYIIRSIGGKLRIGLAEQSLLQALAQACVMTPPCQTHPPVEINTLSGLPTATVKAKVELQANVLKEIYCVCPTYDKIIPVLIKHGIPALPDHCCLATGIPLKPMLASPTRGIAEIVTKFDKGSFMCEYKYDGERAQIHVENDKIRIFSRNQEDNTSKYPDIISRLPSCLKEGVQSCILDSEVVAWDPQGKTILPFQILSTRKRKDAREEDIKVQICIFVFDLLYHNGQSLIKETLRARRDALGKVIQEVEGQVMLAKGHECHNTEEIQELLEESITGKCEGLMVKSLDVDATYEIAKRSKNWLKLKKDYLDGVGDTLDLVVIGGYLGKGKRTGVYGGFLLACYDPQEEQFQAICKIGTGFSDEDLDKHAQFFKTCLCSKPKSYYLYESGHEPDQWFEPSQVWEVKCADLSISPIYKAACGLVDPEKGVSLRFPRFIRVRDDKKPEDATSSSQISSMYKNQEQVKNTDKKVEEEEDFY